MTILDAYGRPVENLGTCHRCGASIKYIYYHEGHTYGSECIEKVTGIGKDDQVFNGQTLDVEASKARKAEREQARLDHIARNKALEEKRENIRQSNRIRYSELINVLNNASRYNGDFCSEMACNISNDGFSTELYEGILSPRQFQIVREIWGKTTGGRMNSKKYNIAVSEFDKNFDS